MKITKHFIIIALALPASVVACKKTLVGSGSGSSKAPTSAASADAEEGGDLSAEMSEIETDVSEETPANETKFDMVKFIKTKPVLAPLFSYIDPEVTRLAVGDRSKFYLETNSTIQVSPDIDAAEERKIIGAFWMRGYVMNKLMTNKDNESGLLVDLGADVTLDKLNMDTHFRYLGVDIASTTVTAGWDQSFVRDFDVTAGADVVVVGVEAGAKMGGEVGMRSEFGIRKDNVTNFIFTPRASMIAGVLGGARLLKGLAALTAEGETKLLDLKVRGNSNLGLVKKTNLLYADMGIDGGSIVLNDGKIDLVGRSVGIEFYRTNVYDPMPTSVKAMPMWGSVIVKYISKPAKSECANFTEIATTELARNRLKLKAYKEVIAEEDKPVVAGSIRRMGDILAKVKTSCGA